MTRPGSLFFCDKGFNCDMGSSRLEKMVNDFSAHASMPHCLFNDLAEEKVVSGENIGSCIMLYTSAQAFYLHGEKEDRHVHTSFENLCHKLPTDRPIRFVSCLSFLQLSVEEAKKLIDQTLFNHRRKFSDRSEDIEVSDGESIIFSSPDPELSEAFKNYLAGVLSPLPTVKEVYVFETRSPQTDLSSLVIGLVLSDHAPAGEMDKVSMLICSGLDDYPGDRDIVDFVEINDEELLEIARSVSPDIKLAE